MIQPNQLHCFRLSMEVMHPLRLGSQVTKRNGPQNSKPQVFTFQKKTREVLEVLSDQKVINYRQIILLVA